MPRLNSVLVFRHSAAAGHRSAAGPQLFLGNFRGMACLFLVALRLACLERGQFLFRDDLRDLGIGLLMNLVDLGQSLVGAQGRIGADRTDLTLGIVLNLPALIDHLGTDACLFPARWLSAWSIVAGACRRRRLRLSLFRSWLLRISGLS